MKKKEKEKRKKAWSRCKEKRKRETGERGKEKVGWKDERNVKLYKKIV
jgi:hypothetical protein